ncbi:DUF6234 family protein [Streptomyces sp. NBC_00090]|uniref:DUF6234 family protein n=1 Tax=Streptomyces sp. NBC_00090 TaxID=2903619 RepID=UPI0032507638
MTTSPQPVRPWADFLIGLLLLALQGAIALWTAIVMGLRQWSAGSGPPRSGPPPMDWVPVLAFGTVAGVASLLAYGMMRGGRRWSAGGQFLAAGLLGIATLTFGVQEWSRSHPAPPKPEVSPTSYEARCVCRSGGGPCECPGG